MTNKPKENQVVKTSVSPNELIKQAISTGADLDELDKLLTLQERWESNEARKAYHQAMADFKANPPKIDKDRKVSYAAGGGKTTYSHASLANVTQKINSELSKHGLSASWTTKQNGDIVVTCKITHSKGHSEETTLSAPADTSGSKNNIQAIGSTITYLERYTLLALTGLATFDQDDDGHIAEAEYITEQQQHIIADMILAVNGKLDKFLSGVMKVDKLENILAKDYQKAIAALEAAIKKYTPPKQ